MEAFQKRAPCRTSHLSPPGQCRPLFAGLRTRAGPRGLGRGAAKEAKESAKDPNESSRKQSVLGRHKKRQSTSLPVC
jgi:hypothetical protein